MKKKPVSGSENFYKLSTHSFQPTQAITMKKTKILYWVFTVLFSGFMIFSAIPNILSNADSVEFMHNKMGYPIYIIPFLGWAKLAGSIALLIPGFNTIKEWAYAGLFFDLLGATASIYAIGTLKDTSFMILPFLIGGLSYYFHHKKSSATV
ncbi:MAG: hypothetical protein RLZZ28_2517 [Bacteroidota bacterium]|jgi:hypothetical protein